MLRSFLTPPWLAWHVAAGVAVVAFVVFGQWQLDAYEGGRRAPRSTPPAALAALVEPGERLPDAAVGREVVVTGEYDAPNQLLVPGRELAGESGFLVVSPLRVADGVVAVSRGWVPRAAVARRGLPAGKVTVRGILQRSEPEKAARVDLLTPLPRGQIPYLATVQLLDASPYDTAELYDGYVALTSQTPPALGGPEPVPPSIGDAGVSRWRNLAYALQWWVFAGAAVFFWAFVVRRSALDRTAGGVS